MFKLNLKSLYERFYRAELLPGPVSNLSLAVSNFTRSTGGRRRHGRLVMSGPLTGSVKQNKGDEKCEEGKADNAHMVEANITTCEHRVTSITTCMMAAGLPTAEQVKEKFQIISLLV